MSTLVRGRTTGVAWAQAIRVFPDSREIFGLVVDIDEPADPDIAAFARPLDALLRRLEEQSVRTVANTIFPSALATSSPTRARFYERYTGLHQGLRRAARPKNDKGLYFERLIRYPLQADAAKANQLETIVQSLRTERGGGGGGLKHAYEMQVFAPGLDVRPMGFPCMSSLSVQIDGPRLLLTATYRNQYYIAKALGNFVGLAGLQSWIAREAGLDVGPLTVHAFHAEIDPRVSRTDFGDLKRALRRTDEEHRS
jgi:hypothetical protein